MTLPVSGACLTGTMAVGAAAMADSQHQPLLSVMRRLPLVQMRGRSQRRAVMGVLTRAVVMRQGHRTTGMTFMPQSCRTQSRLRARAPVPPVRLLRASGEQRRLSAPPGQCAAAQCSCMLFRWSLGEAGNHALRSPRSAMLCWQHAAQLSTPCIAALPCSRCSFACQ